MMNLGQGTEARGIVGASGSFLADSAAIGCVGRLSDAGGALGGEHFGGNLAALRAGVGHGQGFGRGHQQIPSLVNQLESLCETIKVMFNDIKSKCSALSNCVLRVQMKNETLGNMRKVLTDKALLNTMVANTNKSDFLMAEADFKRAEQSCKAAFQS